MNLLIQVDALCGQGTNEIKIRLSVQDYYFLMSFLMLLLLMSKNEKKALLMTAAGNATNSTIIISENPSLTIWKTIPTIIHTIKMVIIVNSDKSIRLKIFFSGDVSVSQNFNFLKVKLTESTGNTSKTTGKTPIYKKYLKSDIVNERDLNIS